jgi:hypothetical protein
MGRFLRIAPVCFGALVMAILSLLLIINLLLEGFHQHPMKLFPGLAGVTYPDKPVFTWDNLLHGTYQAAFGVEIGTKEPVYPGAVRLKNQVVHSLFHTAAIPALVEGPGPRLFEVDYTLDYCARDLASFLPAARIRAAQIRQIQDIEERRGKKFLYVLTPSKVAQYPDILPAGFSCPSTQADRTEYVPDWLAMLRADGVHVVDTTAVMSAAHGKYPFRMYPPGGAHWNDVGAALSMQAVMQGLENIDPGAGFEPFTFTWHMQKHPELLDVDIARLMNLIWPFPSPPVPVVALHPAPPPVPCPKTQVVIVGGSFAHAIVEYLGRTTCLPLAIQYEYWHIWRVTWDRDHLEAVPNVNPVQRAADLLRADVLILEENEQVLHIPQHEEALYDFMTHLPPGQ